MPASTTLPRCSGAARWQQRSASTPTLPAPSRKRTTGSLQIRRASGSPPTSSAQAAMYQALRSSIGGLLLGEGSLSTINRLGEREGLGSNTERSLAEQQQQDSVERRCNIVEHDAEPACDPTLDRTHRPGLRDVESPEQQE